MGTTMNKRTFNRTYHAQNIITHCRQSGQSIDEQGSYLHANGMKPYKVQELIQFIATIGYNITQPFAPLSE